MLVTINITSENKHSSVSQRDHKCWFTWHHEIPMTLNCAFIGEALRYVMHFFTLISLKKLRLIVQSSYLIKFVKFQNRCLKSYFLSWCLVLIYGLRSSSKAVQLLMILHSIFFLGKWTGLALPCRDSHFFL